MHKNIFIGTKSLYVNKIEAMEVDGVWGPQTLLNQRLRWELEGKTGVPILMGAMEQGKQIVLLKEMKLDNQDVQGCIPSQVIVRWVFNSRAIYQLPIWHGI